MNASNTSQLASKKDELKEPVALNIWLVYLTIFGLFSEAIYIHYKIEIKLFYIIVVLGFLVFLYFWDFRINTYHALVLLYLGITGFYGVVRGDVYPSTFVEQIVGISICSTFFYIFLKKQSFGLLGIFQLYAKAAYWVCLLGIFFVPLHSLFNQRFMPLQSFMREPAHFASVILPAAFYFAAKAIKGQGFQKEAWVTSSAVLLSRSATGFLGVMLGLVLLLKNRRNSFLAIPVLVGIAAASLYASVPQFKVRVDDTLFAAHAFDVTGVNLSTYSLLSNAYVSMCVLKHNPILGYGLGGHRLAHDRFIGDLPGSENWGDYIDYNKTDANSLLLRTVSELGLVGLLAELFFLLKFFVRGESDHALVSSAILLYFATKLLREGHWFSPEMYFFVWLYVLIHMQSRCLYNKTQAVTKARSTDTLGKHLQGTIDGIEIA